MLDRRQFLVFGAALLPLGKLLAAAMPSNISVVVGFPAGGAADAVGRLVGDALGRSLASKVIVENRAGASGRIAVQHVKRSAPDGSVLLATPAFPMLISPHLYDDVGYDPLKDFTAVSTTARSMLCFAVGPAVPANVTDIGKYIDWVRSNPDKALFGAPLGSSQHFCGQLFASAAGLDLVQVPYKGGAPAMVDLLGGQIPANVSPVAEAIKHHEAGQIRILAVAGKKRSKFLPDVPTFGEAGYEQVIFQDWLGVFGPQNLPMDVAGTIHQALRKYINTPESIAKLAALGMEPDTVGPDEFPEILREDWKRYGRIIEASGFVPDN